MDYMTQRFDMIAERILENERLTADLDDEAAQALLDWGLSSARLIVDGTAGIEDEEEADEAMYTRLRANSRLMRTVNNWVAKRETMDELASLEEFGKVRYYAATVYAETFTAPSESEWQPFIFSYQAHNEVDMIAKLRNLFDSSGRSLPLSEPVQTEEPAREEPVSPQLPVSEPVQTEEPATEETPSAQLPAQEPVQTEEPATEETPSAQLPAQEPAKVDSPATDNGSKQNVLLGQVPTNKGSSTTDSDSQESHPKSLTKRLWGWVTSFFS